MRTLFLFAAALAVLALDQMTATGETPVPPVGPASRRSAPDRDVQDFVYLGDKGPVLLRFHVSIDGKPLLDVWEEFIDKLFAHLDVNNDGVLSIAEAAPIPPQVLFNNNPRLMSVTPRVGQVIDKNKDGKITRAELADWYRVNGAAPFQFRTAASQQNQFVVVQFAGQRPPLSADALNEKLFALLDADKDGKLSREELTRAPAHLQQFDADDDETVSVQEMSGNAPGGTETEAVFAIEMKKQPVNDVPFLMVSREQRSKELGRELLAHYSPNGKRSAVRTLTRQDLGLDETTFARLDSDEDGKLDTEELSRFNQRAPDLEFRVRLGKKNDAEPTVELVQHKGRPTPFAKQIRPGSGGTLLLEFGSTQIELGGGAESGDPRFAQQLRTQYLAQFRMADKDNNGYLDKNEANQNPLYRNLFPKMDRDGDGKLFEKEVTAYLDKMKELQEVAMQSCASLAVKDQGRGLFDMVDSNSDGRLSVRELRQMVKLVDQLDRDGDGRISRGEIPHKYRVDVRRGPATGNEFTPRAVAIRRMGTNEPPLPERTAGPRWFRKMDRNHDGDVSRREFLGTDVEFRKIDSDGDGLISVEEAERADKLFRQEKQTKP